MKRNIESVCGRNEEEGNVFGVFIHGLISYAALLTFVRDFVWLPCQKPIGIY